MENLGESSICEPCIWFKMTHFMRMLVKFPRKCLVFKCLSLTKVSWSSLTVNTYIKLVCNQTVSLGWGCSVFGLLWGPTWGNKKLIFWKILWKSWQKQFEFQVSLAKILWNVGPQPKKFVQFLIFLKKLSKKYRPATKVIKVSER